MTRMSKTPLIRQSPLTDNWYVVTRYTQKGDHITAHIKYDVTDQVSAIMSAADAEITSLREQVERYEEALRWIVECGTDYQSNNKARATLPTEKEEHHG